MKIAESAPVDFQLNVIFFQKYLLKFFQTAGRSRTFFNGGTEKIFLRLKFCFAWGKPFGLDLLISSFKIFQKERVSLPGGDSRDGIYP